MVWGCSSAGEHFVDIEGVTGSIPVTPTISSKIFDTEVAGFGVRKMVTGIASFTFEKWPKGAPAAKQITLGRCVDWTVGQARDKARQLAIDFSSPDHLSSEVIKGVTPKFYDAAKLCNELILSQKSQNYRDKTLGTLKRC